MTHLVLDDAASRVRIHTFAEGLLARLAHDLALECGGLRGSATRREGALDGDAVVEVPLAQVRVLGVLSGDRIDERGLSGADRHDALAKMRRDVFHVDEGGLVKVEAAFADGTAKLVLTPPNGRAVTLSARPAVRETPAGVRVTCTFEVSIAALGGNPVKGPMSAFKVKDRVEIHADVVFVRP